MMKLSVIILTLNEENNILDCLESLYSVDDIIIVDDNSTDRTVEIVRNLKKKNIRIFKRDLDYNFAGQRNFGLGKAKNKWVLFVDADERVTKGLLSEVENIIDSDNFRGYKIKRTDVIWGRKLKFGETGNMKITRLGCKDSGNWEGRVHEVWKIGGRIGELRHELLHYPHQTIKEFISEINNYSTIRAEELRGRKVTSSFLSVITYTKAKFVYNYLLKLGFLDGTAGFVFALMMSFHSFLVRSKLWLLR